MMKEMHDWLSQDPENVVAVHCLAGHGRTGVIICALFLFEGVFTNPDDAMREFAAKRSKAGKGIKYPSQRRYVAYSAEHIAICTEQGRERFEIPSAPERILQMVQMQHLWVKCKTCRYMLVILNEYYDIVYNSAWFQTPQIVTEQNVVFRPNIKLAGDFTIKLYRTGHHRLVKKMKEVVRIALHTMFLPRLKMSFPKNDVDGPACDTEHAKFPDDLTVFVHFTIPGNARRGSTVERGE